MQNKIKWILLHHSAVSRAKNANQFDAINNYHKSKGWGYIGYNYLIESSGILKHGRDEGNQGAHTIGHNHDSIGICLTGNFDIELPTEAQEKTLTVLLRRLSVEYPKAEVKFHRDFSTKSCPGKLLDNNWHKNNNMKLVMDGEHNQYLISEENKFGWSIPDEKELAEIKKHIKLENPITKDITGYFIIRGGTAKRWKEFLNI